MGQVAPRKLMEFISLKNALDISPEEQSKLGEYNEKIKDIAEFFSDALEAVGDSSFLDALGNAVPWVSEIADSSGIPFVKFATSFLSKLLKQKDPEVLGRLACTLAYQRAVEQAVKKVGEPERKPDTKSIKRELKSFSPSSVVDFKTITLSNSLAHNFIKEADRALLYYSERAGYSVSERTRLQTASHRFFIENLRLILTHRETSDKFEPFRELISMGTQEQSPYSGIENHEEYQRRLFEEARIFNTEPFALQHVYVDTDCNEMTWSEISSKQKDPFDASLPRKPLRNAVMDLIADRSLDDAIVIQGVAGAGKSSFTLRLCRELVSQGFHPIRIRLRDVPLDMNIRDALPKAALLHDPDQALTERGYRSSEDLFIGGNLFRERVFHNGFNICPYVLVLDGWDEISLSAPEGFRLQVSRMLKELREEYLKNRDPKIRVIITGRPSVDVSESHFLLQNTPVLTIRALQPEQLKRLINNLVAAIETAPLDQSSSEQTGFANKSALPEIFEEYGKCFTDGENISGSMEIFSLPLLAHLAMRLVAVSPVPPNQLLQNPTHLYRNLVDEIVWRRGRLGEGSSSIVSETGPDLELRAKLQQTAAAITVFGKESIPSRELAIRLGFKPKELENWASDSTKNHFLTALLINFFFKGGNQKLGCEFLHKSFREYLFAEHIVEILKQFGRAQNEPWSERPHSEYWKDFPEKSSFWTLSRRLAECLSAQWISDEIVKHLQVLIEWEINRADVNQLPDESRRPAEPIPLKNWEYVRDGLADLWDWWAEGVHLRRPVIEDERGPVFGHAYIDELVKVVAARDPEAHSVGMLTVRTITLDSHLGDALFRLNVLVHFEIAKKEDWLARPGEHGPGEIAAALWEGVSPPGKGPRRYQSSVSQGAKQWILFAPSGLKPEYLNSYTSRINAAGWRTPFPSGINLDGVDFRGTTIDMGRAPIWLDCSNISSAFLTAGSMIATLTLGRNLHLSSHRYSGRLLLNGCDLENADLGAGFNRELHTVIIRCKLTDASFEFADMAGAQFRDSPTQNASFWHTSLENVSFDETSRPPDLEIEKSNGE
jgi:hypothetical protein